MIVGVMQEQGYTVEAIDIAKASIPIALIIMIVGTLQFLYFDKKFDKKYKTVKVQEDINVKE